MNKYACGHVACNYTKMFFAGLRKHFRLEILQEKHPKIALNFESDLDLRLDTEKILIFIFTY